MSSLLETVYLQHMASLFIKPHLLSNPNIIFTALEEVWWAYLDAQVSSINMTFHSFCQLICSQPWMNQQQLNHSAAIYQLLHQPLDPLLANFQKYKGTIPSACVILLDVTKTHCLMGQEKYGHKWGHPKGKWKEGFDTSLLDCAVRECQEEMNIDCQSSIRTAPLCIVHLNNGKPLVVFVACTSFHRQEHDNQSVAPLSLSVNPEICQCAWIPISDLTPISSENQHPDPINDNKHEPSLHTSSMLNVKKDSSSPIVVNRIFNVTCNRYITKKLKQFIAST
ncbi:MAG: m7GpppN-mRNA hydrolase [Sylvanvirus sp.]|uniref:M7GpppN-mRNA hydrolase n=1 Tax=Sylvanvirus sp. TaxID=2487774 RepID=A0A3G5AGQ6_9VIRU|nr:MAG: m7GpppN-mRNA hydrolase [Sylvanvirus sp.]